MSKYITSSELTCRCEGVGVWGFEGVGVWGCDGVGVWGCDGVGVWGCEGVDISATLSLCCIASKSCAC